MEQRCGGEWQLRLAEHRANGGCSCAPWGTVRSKHSLSLNVKRSTSFTIDYLHRRTHCTPHQPRCRPLATQDHQWRITPLLPDQTTKCADGDAARKQKGGENESGQKVSRCRAPARQGIYNPSLRANTDHARCFSPPPEQPVLYTEGG